MARGQSRAQSEVNTTLLATPGPQIAAKVREMVENVDYSPNELNAFQGNKFVRAMKIYSEISDAARAGKQVSLTSMMEAGRIMSEVKQAALTTGLNAEGLTAEEMRNASRVTKNNLVFMNYGGNGTYLSSFDKSDPSGQTYTQRVVEDKGTKRELAIEAMKILRNAPAEAEEMKVADVEKFVNDYVRMNLKGKAADNFKGIKWSLMNFPS